MDKQEYAQFSILYNPITTGTNFNRLFSDVTGVEGKQIYVTLTTYINHRSQKDDYFNQIFLPLCIKLENEGRFSYKNTKYNISRLIGTNSEAVIYLFSETETRSY